MKKLLFFCLAILCVISASAQYNITVKIYGFKADSLFLSSFNFEKNKFVVQDSRSYADEVVLKGKKSLAPGYYVISADSMDMAAFFISDEKNQKFQIEVWNDMKQFSGSEENSAFLSMKAREKEFDTQDSPKSQRRYSYLNGRVKLSYRSALPLRPAWQLH